MAQSAARQSHNLKVVSSSLTGGTAFFCFFFFVCVFFFILVDSVVPSDLEIYSFHFYVAYEQVLSTVKDEEHKSAILSAVAMVAFAQKDYNKCKTMLFKA